MNVKKSFFSQEIMIYSDISSDCEYEQDDESTPTLAELNKSNEIVDNRENDYENKRWTFNKKLNEDKQYYVSEKEWQIILKKEEESFGIYGKDRKEFLNRDRKRRIERMKRRDHLINSLAADYGNNIFEIENIIGKNIKENIHIQLETTCEVENHPLTSADFCKKRKLMEDGEKNLKEELQTLSQLKVKIHKGLADVNREIRVRKFPIKDGDYGAESIEAFIESEIIEEENAITLGELIYERFQSWIDNNKSIRIVYLRDTVKKKEIFYKLLYERGFESTRSGTPPNKTKFLKMCLRAVSQ